MVRKLGSAVLVLALCIGAAAAGEFRAVITKVDGNKITFTEFKDLQQVAVKTLPVADSVRVVRGKFVKEPGKPAKMVAGETLDGGLQNEVFTKTGGKGVFSTIVTDAANKQITEIRVFTYGK